MAVSWKDESKVSEYVRERDKSGEGKEPRPKDTAVASGTSTNGRAPDPGRSRPTMRPETVEPRTPMQIARSRHSNPNLPQFVTLSWLGGSNSPWH